MPIPEAEISQMVINGLENNIRKKLVSKQFLDLTQLFDRVRQIENLRMEKENIRKGVKKERITYIDYPNSVETNVGEENIEVKSKFILIKKDD